MLRAMAVKPEARFATVHALGAAMLPFASPKQQVAWSDYYLGDQPPPSIEDPSLPEALAAPPTSSTVYLPETADPIPPSTAPADPGATATLTLHRPEAPATEPDVEVPHRSRRPLRILLLLAVGGATFAGATYLMQHWPAQWRPGKLLPAIAPERLPVREEVVRPSTEPPSNRAVARRTDASVGPAHRRPSDRPATAGRRGPAARTPATGPARGDAPTLRPSGRHRLPAARAAPESGARPGADAAAGAAAAARSGTAPVGRQTRRLPRRSCTERVSGVRAQALMLRMMAVSVSCSTCIMLVIICIIRLKSWIRASMAFIACGLSAISSGMVP